jgi:hypothetical protein
MENIFNMEYSLRTILYLVELQIKEGLEADLIHYKETYPFCDGTKYRQEVLEYLVKYNNDTLNRILSSHRELCDDILRKIDNEFCHIKNPDLTKKDYDIYCTLIKNISFPFSKMILNN